MNKKVNKIEKNRDNMRYAIHSHEMEGFVYTEEEKRFLMDIAEEKMSVQEALKILLEN